VTRRQEDGITILLGLKGYRVEEVTESEDGIVVEVRAGQGKVVCPYCGGEKLYRHGSGRRRKVLHSWSNGKKVYLELHRQRWRCHDCGRSFNDGGELLRPYSTMTVLSFPYGSLILIRSLSIKTSFKMEFNKMPICPYIVNYTVK